MPRKKPKKKSTKLPSVTVAEWIAYRLPTPNESLVSCYPLSGLSRFRLPALAGDTVIAGKEIFASPQREFGEQRYWLDAVRFESLCDTDPNLQAALKKAALVGYNEQARKRVAAAAQRLFLEVYLIELRQQFAEVVDAIGNYLAAKHAFHIAEQHMEGTELCQPPLPQVNNFLIVDKLCRLESPHKAIITVESQSIEALSSLAARNAAVVKAASLGISRGGLGNSSGPYAVDADGNDTPAVQRDAALVAAYRQDYTVNGML